MKYQVLGCDTEFDRITLHESDNYDEAKSWVVGYVRHDNMGGYDAINVVAKNGFTKSEYTKDFGWSHY